MYWETALSSAIEVAIGIAGFSGIAAVLGQRAAGHWSEADQLRLRILLSASGITLIFAFLPFLLLDWFEERTAWRLVSALLATYTVGITIVRFRQARRTNTILIFRRREANIAMQSVTIVLLAANAIWIASPTLYLVGILHGLLIAFMAFVGLLLESWHRPSEGD